MEVWYELKNGRRVMATPASHAVFVNTGDGEMKVEFYEVHIDSRESMMVIGEMQEGEKGK